MGSNPTLQFFWGENVKKWEQSIVMGIFAVVVGCILLLWAFQAVEQINIEFEGDVVIASLDTFFLAPLVFGLLLIGSGIAYLAVTYTIYKLEKQIAH